jgi:hypothetical protein
MKTEEGLTFKTVNKFSAKLILGNQFTIKRLGMKEIHLFTSERLITNNFYRIELVSGDNEKIKPMAEVASSFLKGIQKDEHEAQPIYEVSLKFMQLDTCEKDFVKKLIFELIQKIKNLQKKSP